MVRDFVDCDEHDDGAAEVARPYLVCTIYLFDRDKWGQDSSFESVSGTVMCRAGLGFPGLGLGQNVSPALIS